MFELVFIACLISTPDRCEEKALQYVNVPSTQACLHGAQPQLAKWTMEHPRWRVAKWHCRPVDRMLFERDA